MHAKLLLPVGVLAGALAGGAVTYLALDGAGRAPATRAADGAEAGVDRIEAALFTRGAAGVDLTPMSTLDRLELYEVIASSTASTELEALIQRVAAEPPSAPRRFALDALLMRFAEQDPERAVALAHTLRLETELLVPLFQRWAEQNSRAALAALDGIDNAAAARAIALGLLEIIGDDERGFAQLETRFTAAQLRALRAEALVLRSEDDPLAALQDALTLPDPVAQSAVLARIGQRWAQRDPEAAIAQVVLIQSEQARSAYRNAVVGEWARLDPDAVMAYLRRADTDQSLGAMLPALQSLTSVAEPDTLLAFAAELPGSMRSMARQIALQALAGRDPLAAVEVLDSLTNPAEREMLIGAVANAFARRDPDRALEWARSLRPESQSAMLAVVVAIAEADPERAFELALADDVTAGLPGSFALMSVLAQLRDSARLAGLADRLVARDDFRAPDQIRALLSTWSTHNPEGAIEWITANLDRVDRAAVQGIAVELAARDPEAAIRVLDRLPPEHRSDWLVPVAGAYAQLDPERASAWVMQFQGQTGFDAAVTAIAQRTAMNDPQAVLRLLERVGRPIDAQLAMPIAAGWAAREPAAAADWASRLPAATRDAAASVIAASWSARDPEAAKRWVLGLPSGPARDQALGSLLPNTLLAGDGGDATVMNAFSSEFARQSAIVRTVPLAAMRNRNYAQQLVEDWVTDPALRRQALEMIENSSSSTPAMRILPGVTPGITPGIGPGITQGISQGSNVISIRAPL